jgi:pimeloyl-ACP methyl ester carboxylesterase
LTAHPILIRVAAAPRQNRGMKTLTLALTLTCGLMAQAPFQVKVTGHGRPMILIPGLSCPGEVWDGTVDHYKGRYELHVLSLAGFAGLPRVPGPFLDHVREGIADYVRANKLDHPVIVGHSLGGYVALDLAVNYPELPGQLVIVDSYPMMAGISDPAMTAEKAQAAAAQMRAGMLQQSQDMYERATRSGLFTRPMVTKDADLDRVIEWSLKSDRTAVADAMSEMFGADLRAGLAKVKSPALVMGTWIGYKEYGASHESIEAGMRAQYAKLANVRIAVTDTARHFIMWDDPSWMFAQMDRFLVPAKTASAQ